jgi:hypothetical protein
VKKITLFLVLLSSYLYANAGIYVGIGGGGYWENFTKENLKSSSAMGALKIGYGDRKRYSIELSIDYLKNDSTIFSSSGEDGDKFGFNVALIKAFDFHYLYPYMKAGFGSGLLTIQRELQTSLSYGSYNLATGAFIPLNKTLDLELSYEYRYNTYQGVNTISQRVRYESHINIFYSGINIRF